MPCCEEFIPLRQIFTGYHSKYFTFIIIITIFVLIIIIK